MGIREEVAVRVSAKTAAGMYPAASAERRGRRIHREDVERLDAPAEVRERVLAALDGPYRVRAYLESGEGELVRVVVVNVTGT